MGGFSFTSKTSARLTSHQKSFGKIRLEGFDEVGGTDEVLEVVLRR